MIWKKVNPQFSVIARSAATWQSVPPGGFSFAFPTLGGRWRGEAVTDERDFREHTAPTRPTLIRPLRGHLPQGGRQGGRGDGRIPPPFGALPTPCQILQNMLYYPRRMDMRWRCQYSVGGRPLLREEAETSFPPPLHRRGVMSWSRIPISLTSVF